MSVLKYGDVTLPYCDTSNFSNEAVRDDSDTDLVATKFDIRVACVITDEALDLLAPDLIGRISNPADIMSAIHERLMIERQQLSFEFNGVDVIPKRAGVPGYVDAMNGPKPQSFTYTRLNSTSWLMVYHIIAHYRFNLEAPVDLPGGGVTFNNLPGNVVLSNRWEERVEIDREQMSVRTRTGKILIRSDNDKGWIADQVRSQMAVLSCPATFVRDSSDYTVSKDGLALSYTVRDKECYRMPPKGVTTAEGEYEEESTKMDAQTFGRCWIKLTAPKFTKQDELIRLCASLVASKLDITGAQFASKDENRKGIILMAKMTVGLYENWVRCEMFVRYGIREIMTQGVASWPHPQSAHLHGSDGISPPWVGYDRGSAGLLLQAAAYYDPSFIDTELAPTKVFADVNPQTTDRRHQLSKGNPPGTEGAQGAD